MAEEGLEKRLYRSPSDRMLGGVCGGVSEYFNVDSTIVRIIWALSVVAGGLGLWMYLAAWAIVPERPASAEEVVVKKATHTGLIWGIVLIVIGLFLLGRRVDFFAPGFYYPHWRVWRLWPLDWWSLRADLWLPLFIIIVGVVYLVYVFSRREKPAEEKTAAVAAEEETAGEKTEAETKKRLFRIREGRMIAGVCRGLADHFKLDVSLVRLFWVLGTLLTSIFLGVVVYFVMAIAVPEMSPKESG